MSDEKSCVFCGNLEGLYKYNSHYICKECKEKITQKISDEEKYRKIMSNSYDNLSYVILILIIIILLFSLSNATKKYNLPIYLILLWITTLVGVSLLTIFFYKKKHRK